LRRSFATILADEGLPAAKLRVVMRHLDIKTTLRFYASVDGRRAAEEARALLERAR
jgi:hypothetical protein